MRNDVLHLCLPLVVVCAAALSAAIPSCSSSTTPDTQPDASQPDASQPESFPKDFLLGVATAGFQNDPGCPTVAASECIDPNSDWYAFVTSPDIKADATTHCACDPLEGGPGSYELYAADFDLTQGLDGNTVRLGFEWSRIFPTSTAGIDGYDALKAAANATAVKHYHDVLAALEQRGLKPMVTINHYSLPSWIHDAVGCHKDLSTCTKRGWLDAQGTVAEIAKYAGFVAKEYGGEIDLWCTLNEPFAVAVPGYIQPSANRSNPPAVLFKFAEGRAALTAMIEAHARIYDAVKANDTTDVDGDGKNSYVGLVYNIMPGFPRNAGNPDDVQGAKNFFYLWNEVFLNAAIKGDLDVSWDGTTQHRDDLAGRMDYLGVNYYGRGIVDGLPDAALTELSPLTTFNPLSLTLNDEYPKGMYETIKYVKDTFGLPVIITENGHSDPNDDTVAPRYFVQHLQWLAQAIKDGMTVQGYYYWTLVDNYEWNHGMTMPFGLYKLGADKSRTPRPIADVFRRVGQAWGIPDDLRKQYPID